MSAPTSDKPILVAIETVAFALGFEGVVKLTDGDWKVGAVLVVLCVIVGALGLKSARIGGVLRSIPRLGFIRVEDGNLVERGHRKRVRTELTDHLKRLYDGDGRQAIGDAMGEADVIVNVLRNGMGRGHCEPLESFAANLLVHYRLVMDGTIRAMLNARDVETDSQLTAYLRAWGTLFSQYQTLTFSLYEGNLALKSDPWLRPHYQRWRQYDAKFISAMRDVEHMEGCGELAAMLQGRWGESWRPAPPEGLVDRSRDAE